MSALGQAANYLQGGDEMGRNWKIRHVGFVVDDLDKTISYYQSLDIATMGPEATFESPDKKGRIRGRFAQTGSMDIEFIEPVQGDSLHREFLNKHGDGINHIAFTVEDINQEVDELVGRGVKLVCRGETPDGIKFAFFDTGKIGDVLIELVQPASLFG